MNAALQSAERELAAIDRLLDSPYFGKISLQFEDEETIEDFTLGSMVLLMKIRKG